MWSWWRCAAVMLPEPGSSCQPTSAQRWKCLFPILPVATRGSSPSLPYNSRCQCHSTCHCPLLFFLVVAAALCCIAAAPQQGAVSSNICQDLGIPAPDSSQYQWLVLPHDPLATCVSPLPCYWWCCFWSSPRPCVAALLAQPGRLRRQEALAHCQPVFTTGFELMAPLVLLVPVSAIFSASAISAVLPCCRRGVVLLLSCPLQGTACQATLCPEQWRSILTPLCQPVVTRGSSSSLPSPSRCQCHSCSHCRRLRLFFLLCCYVVLVALRCCHASRARLFLSTYICPKMEMPFPYLASRHPWFQSVTPLQLPVPVPLYMPLPAPVFSGCGGGAVLHCCCPPAGRCVEQHLPRPGDPCA